MYADICPHGDTIIHKCTIQRWYHVKDCDGISVSWNLEISTLRQGIHVNHSPFPSWKGTRAGLFLRKSFTPKQLIEGVGWSLRNGCRLFWRDRGQCRDREGNSTLYSHIVQCESPSSTHTGSCVFTQMSYRYGPCEVEITYSQNFMPVDYFNSFCIDRPYK